jgi:hypothetical protein
MAQHNLTEGQASAEGQKLEQMNRDGNESALSARLLEDYQHLSPASFRSVVQSFDQANETDRASGMHRTDGSVLPDVQITDDFAKNVSGVNTVRPLAADLGWKGEVPGAVAWVPSSHSQFDANAAGPRLSEREAMRSMPNYPDANVEGGDGQAPAFRRTHTDQSISQPTQRYYVNGQVLDGVSGGSNTMSSEQQQQILNWANQRRQNRGY